jgi:hypothetical protein
MAQSEAQMLGQKTIDTYVATHIELSRLDEASVKFLTGHDAEEALEREARRLAASHTGDPIDILMIADTDNQFTAARGLLGRTIARQSLIDAMTESYTNRQALAIRGLVVGRRVVASLLSDADYPFFVAGRPTIDRYPTSPLQVSGRVDHVDTNSLYLLPEADDPSTREPECPLWGVRVLGKGSLSPLVELNFETEPSVT